MKKTGVRQAPFTPWLWWWQQWWALDNPRGHSQYEPRKQHWLFLNPDIAQMKQLTKSNTGKCSGIYHLKFHSTYKVPPWAQCQIRVHRIQEYHDKNSLKKKDLDKLQVMNKSQCCAYSEWCCCVVFFLHPTGTCDSVPWTPSHNNTWQVYGDFFSIYKYMYYSMWSLCLLEILAGTLTFTIQSRAKKLWVTAQGFTLSKGWITTWICNSFTSVSSS